MEGLNLSWYDSMMDTINAMTSEDVMDNCVIVSWDRIKEKAYKEEN